MRLVEREARVYGARPEQDAREHVARAADWERPGVFPVHLTLLYVQCVQTQVGLGGGGRPQGADLASHLHGRTDTPKMGPVAGQSR